MIADSLGLFQTERSAEGYKYPSSARIFYKKQKNQTSLFLPKFLHSAERNRVLAIGFCFFLDVRATNLHLRRGLTHRPELGAGVLPGEFLPLGEEATFKVRTRDRPTFF